MGIWTKNPIGYVQNRLEMWQVPLRATGGHWSPDDQWGQRVPVQGDLQVVIKRSSSF